MVNKKILIFLFTLSCIACYLKFGKVKTIVNDVSVEKTSFDFNSIIAWPTRSSEKKLAGQGVGVAINSDDNLVYLHRGKNTYDESDSKINEATIIIIDSNSLEVIKSFGENIFVSPHGLAVDNQNNIWVTDIKLNKIFKMNSDGEILKEYGKNYPFYLEALYRLKNIFPKLPMPYNSKIFARPTDLVICDDGSFIVTDGYRNNRLVKFDSEGELVWEVNKAGNRSGEFNLPHGISQDDKGRIFVADRQNQRIQVFSSNGKWLENYDEPDIGRAFALEFRDGFLYVADGGDMLDVPNSQNRSRIVKLDENGIIVKKHSKFGLKLGELNIPHDISVDSNGNVYIAELYNKRVQKFIFNVD